MRNWPWWMRHNKRNGVWGCVCVPQQRETHWPDWWRKTAVDVYLFSGLAQLSARPCDAVPLPTLFSLKGMSIRHDCAKKYNISRETKRLPGNYQSIVFCFFVWILLKDVLSKCCTIFLSNKWSVLFSLVLFCCFACEGLYLLCGLLVLLLHETLVPHRS